MKALHLLLAMAVSLMPARVVAQSSAQQSGTQSGQASQQDNQSTQTNSGSTQKMSGKVSHDGKSVVNDSDNKNYSVNNPNALQNYEDQHVAMIVQVDPDDNVIHIISVAPPQP
jgi:hypothetical protein